MNRLEDLRTLEKGADALSQKAGRNVSYQDAAEQSGMSAPRTGNALSAAHRDLSLDAPINPDGATLLDVIHMKEATADAVEDFEGQQRDEAIYRSLARLDRREEQILRSYYGLNAEEPKTLEEIGHELGLTRERIRQLRNRALSRLEQVHGKSLLDWSAN
jgi:RNA polymerase primary sigma factor